MGRPQEATDISPAALGDARILHQVEEGLLIAHFMGVSRLFQEIAHDMRGPLHSMTLHLELIRLSLDETPGPDVRAKQERYLGSIGAEIQRIARMIEALWGHSGTPDRPMDRFDLRETVHALSEVLEPHCRRTRVRLRVRVPEMPVEIEGNPGAIRHAALDLVAHALETIPDGGDLELSVERKERDVVLRVSDMEREQGTAGVPAGEERIASAPSSEPDASAAPATPRLARLVIEAHGGSLRVISNGSRPPGFELTLPLPSPSTQPKSQAK
jgi:signal transduction histidine kinase